MTKAHIYLKVGYVDKGNSDKVSVKYDGEEVAIVTAHDNEGGSLILGLTTGPVVVTMSNGDEYILADAEDAGDFIRDELAKLESE